MEFLIGALTTTAFLGILIWVMRSSNLVKIEYEPDIDCSGIGDHMHLWDLLISRIRRNRSRLDEIERTLDHRLGIISNEERLLKKWFSDCDALDVSTTKTELEELVWRKI